MESSIAEITKSISNFKNSDSVKDIAAIERQIRRFMSLGYGLETKFDSECPCGCSMHGSLLRLIADMEYVPRKLLVCFVSNGWMDYSSRECIDYITNGISSTKKVVNVCDLLMNFFDVKTVVEFFDEDGASILDRLFDSSCDLPSHEICSFVDFLEKNGFDFTRGNQESTYLVCAINKNLYYLIIKFHNMGISPMTIYDDNIVNECILSFEFALRNQTGHFGKVTEVLITTKLCLDIGVVKLDDVNAEEVSFREIIEKARPFLNEKLGTGHYLL